MTNPEKTRSQGVSWARIDAKEAGQRIDNYLLRRFKGVPKSHIYRILRRGEVRINKKRVKPAYKLVSGDEIRLPPVRYSAEKTRRPPDEVIKRVQSRIIYDDDRIIVVNKPAGLPVHAGTGYDYGLIDALHYMELGGDEVFLVHRLDRETSGCLLIARDREAMKFLHHALRETEIRKHYLALLMGRWRDGRQLIDIPLSRSHLKGGERLSQADESGKQARSIFSPVQEFHNATLMKVEILTGRTHQIRAHAAALGHPLAGDRQYGNEDFNYAMKSKGLKRLFLHAQSLEFPHPDDGQVMKLEPPLDEDLQLILDRLRNDE